jgi:hypothetical protein
MNLPTRGIRGYYRVYVTRSIGECVDKVQGIQGYGGYVGSK